jgi:hypothetical protein
MWMQKLGRLKSILGDECKEPIKVAILDTGAHFHPDLTRFYGPRLESWSWFQNAGSDVPQLHSGDHDGHGTHLASIVLDLAPTCKVYTAQIYKRRKDVQDKQSNEIVEQNIAKVPNPLPQVVKRAILTHLNL